VERPLRDADGQVVLGTKGKQKGKPQADPALRDTENVPLAEDVEAYFEREVRPHAPDAWIDHERTKVGTRSRSAGTSTCSRRRGRWRRSTRSWRR
jgi:type I restriction enzyme M protein